MAKQSNELETKKVVSKKKKITDKKISNKKNNEKTIVAKKDNSITVSTKYTEEGYYKFNQEHYHFIMRKKKWWFIIFLVMSIPLVFTSLFADIAKSYPIAIFFVLLDVMILLEICTNLLPNLQVKRMLKKDQTLLNIENNYNFTETEFSISNEFGSNKVLYEDIYQVLETTNHLYIYINKVGAFIILKDNLSEKDKNTITKLLKELLGNKYYQRKR